MGVGSALIMPADLAILMWTFTGPARSTAVAVSSTSMRRRHGRGPGSRRRAARPLLVGFGLPGQRAGGRPRADRCRPAGPGLPQPCRTTAGPGRNAAVDQWPRGARLRTDPLGTGDVLGPYGRLGADRRRSDPAGRVRPGRTAQRGAGLRPQAAHAARVRRRQPRPRTPSLRHFRHHLLPRVLPAGRPRLLARRSGPGRAPDRARGSPGGARGRTAGAPLVARARRRAGPSPWRR